MSANRIVAFLTPLVFAPAAGAVSAWLASHFPGTNIKESDLQAIFIGGALIALAPAAQWLHGWQKFEARQADSEQAVELANANAIAAAAASQPADQGQGFEDVTDLDGLTLPDEFDAADDFDTDLSLLVDDGEPAQTVS